GLFGEGDVVAAGRPHWRRVDAIAEADALRWAAIRPHDVDLLFSAAVGLKADARPVWREGGRGIDRESIGQARGRLRAQVHQEDVGIAALLQAHDHALAVG